MMRIAYYIDSHGFGHSTRSIAAATEFPADWTLILRTNGPKWLFEEELPRPFEILPSPLDLHPVQSNGYRIDPEATIHHLLERMKSADRLIDQERRWIEENRIDQVVSDISPLAVEAAARAGVPSYGVSNFTWHWILEPMVLQSGSDQAIEAVKALEEMTGRATKNFRLPFSAPETFPPGSIETPLLIRSPRKEREDLRREWGFDPNLSWVLITFGGFDESGRDLSRLAELAPLQFLRTLPQAERKRRGRTGAAIERDSVIPNLWWYVAPDLHHPDLVGAVDAVITKPGYGILSETMPLGKPILLDRRPDFREFEVVERVLETYPQASFLPSERMAAFDFEPELTEILNVEAVPWRGRTDGARFIFEGIQ